MIFDGSGWRQLDHRRKRCNGQKKHTHRLNYYIEDGKKLNSLTTESSWREGVWLCSAEVGFARSWVVQVREDVFRGGMSFGAKVRGFFYFWV